MKEFLEKIDRLLKQSKEDTEGLKALAEEKCFFPFTTESNLLTYFLAKGIISYEEYLQIKNEYYERNKYLDLFDLAPRTYGQTWGEKHIISLLPEFTKATKRNLKKIYPEFSGEFDLWLDGIRVEVKACRANNPKGACSLARRAYSRAEVKAMKFEYHFQQLKPSCCDVFIWIGTCRDELTYWVLTSDELRKTGKLTPQHRNEKTGVAGVQVFEGQVWMTEEELKPFLVEEKDILNVVRKKGLKQIANKTTRVE